jgi:hypothetical protein
MKIDKAHIQKLLFEGSTLVTFTKQDGTRREMKCTLAKHLLPLSENTAVEGARRVENDNLVKTYDLENQGWRSFNVSNVISILSTHE